MGEGGRYLYAFTHRGSEVETLAPGMLGQLGAAARSLASVRKFSIGRDACFLL